MNSITLTLSPKDAAIIMKALGSMPLQEALPTFLAVQTQLAKQAAPAAPPAAPVEPPAGHVNGG